MGKCYRVTFECYEKENPSEVLSKSTVLDGTIEKPTNRLNFSMGLRNQIECNYSTHPSYGQEWGSAWI